MVHVRNTTEDDINDFPVVVLTTEILYNPKDLNNNYLSQNCTGAWDKGKCKKFADITVRDILKSILLAETLNHWVDDRSVETVSMTIILPKVSVSSSDISEYPDYNTIINKEND